MTGPRETANEWCKPYNPPRRKSSQELVEGLTHRPHADQIAPRLKLTALRVRVGGGHHDPAESHLRRFAHAQRSLRCPSNLAAQSDLTEECRGGARLRLRTLDATAATTLKSAAGSSMLIPPAMFT